MNSSTNWGILIMTRKIYDKFRGFLYSIPCSLLLVSLASCYPKFKNPIPPPSKLKADSQILGTWVRTNESDSKQQLLIFQRSSGWIDVIQINDIDSKESESGISVVVFEGYSTSVNKQKFLCLRLREKDWEGKDTEVGDFYFLIVNYEATIKDKLILRLFSLQKVKELIKEGKLKGEVVRRGQASTVDVDRVIVTSNSDKLVEVISREGVGAFIGQDENEILMFSKIGKDIRGENVRN
jgi:hypothetical protein